MKDRLLESLAILLAGLFSAERPRSWQLGDAAPRPAQANGEDEQALPGARRPEN